MSLYSTETQPNAMGGKAENGPETISDPKVKKYTGNKEITSWCYLFIHHAKVETVSKKLQTEQYRIFVHKSIVYKRGNKRIKKEEQATISGLVFIQGDANRIQKFLKENFFNLYLVKDCSTGEIAAIPDSVMQPFMRVSEVIPTRIRFMPHFIDVHTAIHTGIGIHVKNSIGTYIITEITHVAGMGDSYQNYFTALPSSIPTLPCPDVPLPVAHTQQAVVVSNEDPKKLGRVQVKMNWQTGPMQTSWIRVLTPDAGTSDKVATNRGFVFIPEKGDQVMVAFRYDDPNRPFVLGSLFHGKSGTGGGSSNKTKSLTTRSGCTITLDDEKGSVMMKDKEGNSYTADGEGNITISASKSITLCVGENKIMIDSEGNISSNAEKDITESAGANIAQSAENIDCTASSNYNISSTDFTATGSSSATVSGTTKATIDSSGTTAVAGTIVKLN